mgnify:CR=1 FL=1
MSDRHRHIPPWDKPVSGYDAGSIGEHWIHRHFPSLARDAYRQDRGHEFGEICRSMETMLREALEYGAAQIRYRYLMPRSVSIYAGDGRHRRAIGHYHECRFCGARTTEQYPDSIEHASTCLLLHPHDEITIEAASRFGETETERCTIIKR